MKTTNFITSACRACRFYRPEGRRGGSCQQLGVPVRGSWKACSLAIPPFAPSWESLEGLIDWQTDKTLPLEETVSNSDYYLEASEVEATKEVSISTYKI